MKKSSVVSEDDLVCVNWLFFDQLHPNDARPCVFIPRQLFEAPSQFCQELFSTELHEWLEFQANPKSISFMWPIQDLSLDDSLEEGWMTSIKNIRSSFKPIPLALSLADYLEGLKDNIHLVHLVVTAKGAYTGERDEQHNRAGDLPEICRYRNIISTKGQSPSEGAKSTGYPTAQDDPLTAIYDGRYPQNQKISTVAPPLQLFHPVFATFLHLLRDPKVQPTRQELRYVRELLHYAAMVGLSEATRNAEIRKKLTNILQLDVHEEPNIDRSFTDGVHIITIHGVHFPILIVELKRELGDGGCDPSTQAGLSMRRSWIQVDRADIRDKCACPTFMLAGGGPWLAVMGGVFTDKFIVQRLTSLVWMAESSTEEDA